MTFWCRASRSLLLVLIFCGCTSGCFLSGQSSIDEQKEPHFLDGKRRQNALDYKGAIECFEKSLQVNPKSGSAHLELACLYDKNESDPAAAIYHFERYLKFQQNAGNADVIRQRILACKQDLARSVFAGLETQSLQNEFEKLRIENQRLREELEKFRSYYDTKRGGVMPENTLVTPRVMLSTNYNFGNQASTQRSGPSVNTDSTSVHNNAGHAATSSVTRSLINDSARSYSVQGWGYP